MMPVKSEMRNGIHIVSVQGDLSGDCALAVRLAAVEAANQNSARDVVLDMEKCGYIDSRGLESLLEIKRNCESRLGQLRLAALGENSRKILEITRLNNCLDCHPNLELALKAMR